MEFTNHSVLSQQPSTQFPQSSTHCFSSTQQAGYMGQQPGCTNLFGQYNSLYLSSDILTVFPFPDKREVILREIEKERIRAQLIVSEIAKMHVLEGEINKEPRQVEAAKLRVSELKSVTQNQKSGNLNNDQERTVQSVQKNGDPKKTTVNIWCEICQVGTSTGTFMNNHEKGKKHLRRLKEIVQKGETGEGNRKENMGVLLNSAEHVSENGNSSLSRNFDVVMDEAMLELRKPVYASGSEFETLPVQIWSADRRVSEVTPLTKNGNEEDKIVFVDNQDAIICGSKLKAVTDASKCPSNIILHKKSDREQSFGDSQVNVTSESVPNEHLREKKQRFSEVSSKPRSPGKNCRIDTSLEKSELPNNPKPEKDQAKTLQSVQRSPDLKNTMHKFWCEMCQVGAHSEIVMNNHEKGKKHVKRLKNRAQNGEIGPSYQNEKMEVSAVQHFSEGGKNVISETVYAYEKGSHKFVFESKAKEEERDLEVTGQDEIGQGVDMIESEVDLIIDAVLPEDDDIIAKGKWSCDLCQVFAVTASALNELLLGRNQKLKEASLKTLPPGRDSGLENIVADTTLPIETESLENSKPYQLKTLSQKNDGPKRTTNSFCHEKCQVGPLRKKNISDCEEEIVQNGESGPHVEKEKIEERPCVEKEKIEEPVNCDKHISEDSKILLLNNDDVVSAEARLELENTMDTSDDGFETFLIHIGAADLRFSDVQPVSEKVKEEGIVQRGDFEPCIEKKIEEPMNCDTHSYEGAKSIFSNNVDLVSAEAELELEKPLDISDIGFENFLIQVGTVDISVSEVKPVAENGESEPCIEKGKIKEHDKHISEIGKSILSNNVDVVSAETRLELDEPLDTSDNGFEISLIQFGTVDLRVSEVKPIAEEDKIVQNSESEPCIEKEKTEEPMKGDKHISEGGKGIFSNNVGEISAESRLKLESFLDTSDNGSETSPTQFRMVDFKVSNVKHIVGNDNKEESILVVNPDVDSSKRPSDILYKNSEAEQCCVESALNEQQCGKIHKVGEASLKSQSPGKNSNIGSISRDTLLMKKTGLLENPKSDNFKNDPSVQKKGDPKKNKDNFCREKRRIRRSSGNVIDEEKGGKDANHLENILQNSETKMCSRKENIEVSVNYDAHKVQRSTISDDVDVVSGEAKLELHKRLDASDNGFESLSIQIEAVDLRVPEVKPIMRNDKKEEIIFVANPDANISGSKCQTVTPTALKDMCEKKHKLKEDSLKLQSPGKHCGIGKFPCDILLSKETELLVNLKSDSYKKDHVKKIQSVQKNDDPKMTKDLFQCEKNQVGTSSDIVVRDEEKGRIHNEIVRNGETEPCGHKEKIDEHVNCVKHISEAGKFMFPYILAKQGAKATGVDVAKSGHGSTLHAFSPKDGKINVQGEWNCALCQVIAPNEFSLNEHFCGKKHKLKEASLKTLPAFSPKDGEINVQGEWNCALCQVIAPNESSLNEHLCGKKHKFKEASLKAQRPGNDSSMRNVETVTLLDYSKSVNIVKDNAETNRSVGKKGDLKKSINSWFDGRQVGPSEEVTYELEKASAEIDERKPFNLKAKMKVSVDCVEHVSEREKSIFSEMYGQAIARNESPLNVIDEEKGGKDTNHLENILQNSETKMCSRKENIEVSVNYDAHKVQRSTISDDVDVVSGEAKLELHKRLDASDNGFESLSIQIEAVDLRVPEVKPIMRNDKKEEIIFVANPDANISGSKCQTVTPTALKDMCEKKHKLKEDSLKLQSPGKHCGIGKFPCDILLSKETELLVNLKSDSYKKDHVKKIQSVQKNDDPKMTKDLFQCEKNQVGTSSDIVVRDEEKGRIHNEIVRNGETEPCGHKEKIDEHVNCVKHISEAGKFMFPHILAKQGAKATGVDVAKSGHGSTLHAFSPKDGKINVQGEWNCALCQVIAPNEFSLNEHFCGKKHKLKEASLKTLPAFSPKDGEINVQGEWNCALCQVIAPNESSLNEHLCGKKHKFKEASLKAQRPGNDSSMRNVETVTLLDYSKSVNIVKDNAETNRSVGKKGDLKKSINSWFDGRQVGPSEEVTYELEKASAEIDERKPFNLKAKMKVSVDCVEHVSEREKSIFSEMYGQAIARNESPLNVIDEEKGGKDTNHLKDILQNSETKMCNQKENIEVSVNYYAHNGQRSTISDDVDVVSGEARLELHKRLDASDNGFETLSIQIEALDLRVPEVKPIMRNDKKEEIIFVANPDANISGSKCQTVTPTALKDTCEKKHKLKEDSLKLQSPGKHCGIGKFPCDILLSKETELLVNLKSDSYKKDHVKKIQSVQKNDDPNMTKDLFRREKNQVGTCDEEKGRIHNEIVQNGETEPFAHKEKIDEHVNCVKHISEAGKFMFPHILAKQGAKATGVDVAKSGHGSTLHAFSPKDGEINVQGEWNCALCQVIAPNESSLNEHLRGKKHKSKEASLKTLPAFLPKDGEVNVQGEWSCALCQVIAPTESSLNEHLRGKKHKLKEDSLKTLPSFSPKDDEIDVKGEWNYSLCQVIVPNESSLNEHLCGKKHKFKEASLKAQRPGNDSSMINVATVTLMDYSKSDNTVKDNAETNRSVGKNGDLKKSISSGCDDRQVGPSEKVTYELEKAKESAEIDEHKPSNLKAKMEVSVDCVEHVSEREKSIFSEMYGQAIAAHESPLNVIDEEKGGKDANHLKDILQNSETKMCNQKENIEVFVNYDTHKGQRSTISDDVDVVFCEARLELHKRLDASDNGFGTLSIQIEAVDLRVPEVKPIMRNDNKEEIIFVANPDANISGSKCQTVTPTARKDMCEKKHKLKEDSLKPQSPGKYCGIGKFPCDTLLSKETELLVNLKSDSYKKHHVKTIQSVQKNDDPKMTKDLFRREKNQEGTSPDIVVHDEEKGRIHNEIVRDGETEPCDLLEKVDEHVNCVKHISEAGTFIFPHILAKQGAKATGVNITKSGHGSTLHAFSPKDGERNAQGEWNCALCQVIAPTESSLNEHLRGKKHKLKEASLKTLHAFSPKDGEVNVQGEWNCALCQVIAPTESSLNEHHCGKKHNLKEASLKTRESGKESSAGTVATVTLLEYSKSDNTIKDDAKTDRSVGKNGDLKKTIDYWCDGCQVGPSEKVTYNLKKAKVSAEIDERMQSNLKERMEVSVDCVEHVSKREKSIFSDMFGQVIATNESPLNDHKLKEASLKTQRPGNNFSVGNTLLKSDNIKEDSAKTIRSAGKDGDFKKTKYSYWRKSCQVGPSEKVTHNLEKGKEIAENDKREPYNEKEKMKVPVSCVACVSESEKFSGVVYDQPRLELPNPLDATNNGGHKRMVKQNEKRWQIKK